MDPNLSRAEALQQFRAMRAAAVKMQAAVRGMLAKKKLAFLRYAESQEWLNSRATRLAAIWKGHRQQTRYRVLLAARKAKEMLERQERAATAIQSHCRTFLARIKFLARLKERHLDPRLRRHAEKYIAKGDIWTVLRRVDLDFRFIDSEYREEEDNVRVFIKDVLEKRENDMRHLTLDFREAVETNENAQAARSLNNASLSDFDRLALKAAPTVESMVVRDQETAKKLARSKMRYLESLQPKTVDMAGATVKLDSGAMKDSSPFEVQSLDDPVHPLIMLGVALTYPPDEAMGSEAKTSGRASTASSAARRQSLEAWLASSLDLKKVEQREALRQRAAPYVETLREAGIHTVRDLEGVSLLAHGFPLPLRDTVRQELRRVQQEEADRHSRAAEAQARLDRQREIDRRKGRGGASGPSSFAMPEGLLRSEQQVYAPKNFVGKLVKPTRARQQALAWLQQLDKNYGVAHLDDPHDKFITYVFLRFLSSRELEDFEWEWKEREKQRTRDSRPVKVEPEVGHTFVDFLQHLVQKNDTEYRRAAMARRSRRAFRCAEETILLLKGRGYETVRSLLLCPLQALGVEEEPAAEIALGIKKLSKANPWLLTKYRKPDTRYARTATDTAIVPGKNPLPPLVVPTPAVGATKRSNGKKSAQGRSGGAALGVSSGTVRIKGGQKRVRARMKAINRERPHPRNVTAYNGAKSTAKAFVRLKTQALLEMSHETAEGREYHKWKNDEKLTEAVMLRRQRQQLEAALAEQQRQLLADEEADRVGHTARSAYASLVPQQEILHPLERLEADNLLKDLWPPELHAAMRSSTLQDGAVGVSGSGTLGLAADANRSAAMSPPPDS